MNKDLEVGIKITADSKEVTAAGRDAINALNQLGDTAERANTKSSVAAEQFTAKLKRQADTLGKTASEIRGYDAAQMQLTSAQKASVDASNRAIDSYEKQQAALGNLKMLAIGAGAAIGVSFVAGLKASVTMAGEAEQSHLRLAAVLRGTGHAAGLTKADLDAMADGMKEKLGIDDDALRDSMAVLLTFRNISKDSFGEALETSANLAAVMQTDLKSAVLQLGKALESPEEGLTALKRSGVSFTETQKDMIKGMVDTGNQAEAITLILKTMKEQGLDAVAESMNQGITKATRDAGLAWDDFLKSIGNTSAVKGATEGFFAGLSGSLKDLRQAVESGDWLDRLTLFATGIKTPSLIAKINSPSAKDDSQARIVANEGLERQKAAQAAEILAIAKKKADEESAKSAEESSKRAIAAARSREDADKRAYQQSVEGSTRVITALKNETEQIGLNVTQKKMMSAAAEAAKAPTQALAQEIMASAQAWGVATQRQEEMMAAEKERLDAIKAIEEAEKSAAKVSEEAARKSAADWNQLWGGVEQTAKSAFIQFAAHGKSAMESIGESIKLAIIDVLYQLTVRKWIINIGAAIGMGGGSGMAMAGGIGGGGSGAGLLNMASLGSSAMSLLNGGLGATSLLSTLGSSLPGSAGSFFTGMGMSGGGAAATASGMSSAASMGASFASFAGPAIAIAAVDQITRMLAGDKMLGGTAGKALNYVPVLGPLINGLFGRGPMKQGMTTLKGDVGADGFESGMLQTRFDAEGGAFRSNKTDFAQVNAVTGEVWTDNGRLQAFADDLAAQSKEIIGLINDATRQASGSLRKIGEDLGLSTAGLESFSHKIKLVSEAGKGLTEEQIGQEIAKITEEMAKGLLPEVADLSRSGESAFATLSRLNAEFDVLTNLGAAMGKSLADTRTILRSASFGDRSDFVEKAGGADVLSQNIAAFSQNYLTETQQLAPILESVNGKLNELGLSGIQTKDQFRDVVQSLDLATESGQEMFIGLMDIQSAFLNVAAATAKAQTELDVLTNLGTAFGYSLADTKKLLGGMQESDRSAFVDQMGGAGDLSQKIAFFKENYLSAEQNLAPIRELVEDTLADLGISGVRTRDQFRDVVQSLDLTTEAGKRTFSGLMEISGAFLQMENQASSAGRDRSDEIAARRTIGAQQAESIKQQAEAAAKLRDEALGLRDSLILAGDAAALLSNELKIKDEFPKSSSYTSADGQFVAGAFNAAFASIQAANAKGLANSVSANALRVQDVGGLMGQLFRVITSDEVIKPVYLGIRNAIVDGSGDLGNTVRDAVDGFAKTMATEQSRLKNAPRSEGLASVLSAGADLSFVSQGGFANGKFQFGRDVISYGQAIDKLDARLRDGSITVAEHTGAMSKLNDAMGGNARLLGDTEAQMSRIAGASMGLAQAGLGSIAFYFSDIRKQTAELAQAASEAAEPIAKATEAIGRMKSISTVFGASAAAVLGGLQGAGELGSSMLASEARAGSQTNKAMLVSAAAGIAAQVLTTADAANLARKLSTDAAFANTNDAGLRDVSLLLDGLKTFDAQSFENSFLRINDALAGGKINEQQYSTLFNTAMDIFEGVDDSAGGVKSAFGQLRDAAKSAADQLLLNKDLSTLDSQQSLTEAQRQFDALMVRVNGGDAGAAGELSGSSSNLLRIAQDTSTNRVDYARIFGSTVASLRGVESLSPSNNLRLDNQPIVDQLVLLRKEIEQMRIESKAASTAIATNTSKTTDTLNRWTVVGLPATEA